jgi:hypothetical protein
MSPFSSKPSSPISGLERTLRLDGFSNSLRVDAAGSLGAFSDDLNGSVA